MTRLLAPALQRASAVRTWGPASFGRLVLLHSHTWPMLNCEVCSRRYPENGDGYAGLCPRCADLTDSDEMGDLPEASRRAVLRRAFMRLEHAAAGTTIDDAIAVELRRGRAA